MTHDAAGKRIDPTPAGSRLGAGLGFAVISAMSFGLSGALAKGLLDAGWSAGAAVAVRVTIAALVLVVPAAIALHARTAAQLYSGRADWSAIARLKAAVTIPVLGNGDVWQASDAIDLLRQTGADGVVVGATQYEHGRDTAPAVTGVRELLDDACAVLPALGEYELAECAAGLRPMTPDGLPIVERLDERTLVAAGHGRNGFLLAPWTAERIVAELNVAVGANR